MARAARILPIACVLVLLGASAPAQPSGPPSLPAAEGGVFSGLLLPGRTALIKSRFDDRVAEVPRSLGARVRAGELLLRFADDEHRVALERAAAQLERAEAELERARRLHEQQQLAAEEFERAQTARRLARADRDLAAIRLRERSVLAPFDGVLAERHVDPGASVTQGDPLLRVTATTPLRVHVLLPESVLPRLRSYPTLRVSLASPDTTLWLPIRQRPMLVDPASGMFPLQVEVDNSRGRLIPGVSCRVALAPRRPGRTR